MNIEKRHFYLGLVAFLLFFPFSLTAQDSRFVVVLDAGHGGHDPGAMGAISREKDINLAITLDLGAIIERNFKDVKVVYSRKTDKYLTLQERANVVNDNHANLFICIHTNSSPSSSSYGAESYTLGLAKTKSNLDVAMRENSVITLEENYKTKYKGFDPNSVDSYIMFEFMQDKYIDRSIDFASTVQKQFRTYSNRADRGVRQAGFWVLHRSACPSVLVEVGFISNPAEERYLTSEQGQREMATAIFNAFVDFKRNHDKKLGRPVSSVSKITQSTKVEDSSSNAIPEVVETPAPVPVKVVKTEPVDEPKVIENITLPKNQGQSKSPVFKVQLFATVKMLKPNAPDFKGVKDVSYFTEGGLYKYTVGSETDYAKIEKVRKDVSSKFPQAFIVAFVDNQKMSAKDVLKLMKENPGK